MKIQFLSDLHLEFTDNYNYLKTNPIQVTGEVLLLAGDIGYLNDDNYQNHPFWNWASKNYEQVIVLPGNHEFYKHYDISTLFNGWELAIRDNTKCYYNKVVTIENVDIIVSTLWSHITLENAYETEHAITDFHRIRYKNELLDWSQFNAEHDFCFNFIKDSVEKSNAEHIIVATHHVPSFQLIAPEYEGSKLNGAFTVDLTEYIQSSPIEYWIYGHSHHNVDKIIGTTHCISNQLGYVFHNEHTSFYSGKYIEIV